MVGHGKDLGGERQNIRASGDFALVVYQHRGRCHPTDARRRFPLLLASNRSAILYDFILAILAG